MAGTRRGGQAAKLFGDLHEEWHAGQLNAGVLLGIVAHWVHPEPKYEKIKGMWTPAKRTVADFIVTLEPLRDNLGAPYRAPARTLVAETKSVDGARMPRSMIDRVQAEHLEAVARAGGLAFLVGEFRLERTKMRFACPWLDVPWEVKISAESVTPELMAPWDVSTHLDCYLKRWHPGGPRSGTWRATPRRSYPTE